MLKNFIISAGMLMVSFLVARVKPFSFPHRMNPFPDREKCISR